MFATAETIPLTVADYLELDNRSAEKYEWYQGAIWAMGGASDRHVTVSLNLFMQLRQKLKASRCKTYIADMRVRVEAIDAYFYPDLLVTCSPRDHLQSHQKSEPIWIAEVLSPTTEAYDRGKKFAAYRQLASLQSYTLIELEEQRIDCFEKRADGIWELYSYTVADGIAPLPTLGIEIDLTDLFAEQ